MQSSKSEDIMAWLNAPEEDNGDDDATTTTTHREPQWPKPERVTSPQSPIKTQTQRQHVDNKGGANTQQSETKKQRAAQQQHVDPTKGEAPALSTDNVGAKQLMSKKLVIQEVGSGDGSSSDVEVDQHRNTGKKNKHNNHNSNDTNITVLTTPMTQRRIADLEEEVALLKKERDQVSAFNMGQRAEFESKLAEVTLESKERKSDILMLQKLLAKATHQAETEVEQSKRRAADDARKVENLQSTVAAYHMQVRQLDSELTLAEEAVESLRAANKKLTTEKQQKQQQEKSTSKSSSQAASRTTQRQPKQKKRADESNDAMQTPSDDQEESDDDTAATMILLWQLQEQELRSMLLLEESDDKATVYRRFVTASLLFVRDKEQALIYDNNRKLITSDLVKELVHANQAVRQELGQFEGLLTMMNGQLGSGGSAAGSGGGGGGEIAGGPPKRREIKSRK